MHRGSQVGNRHLGAKDTSQDAFKAPGSIFLASGILSCGQSHPTGLKWAERHLQEMDLKQNLGFAKPSANCGQPKSKSTACVPLILVMLDGADNPIITAAI